MNKEKRDIRVVFLVFAGLFGLLGYKNYPSVLSYVFISTSIILTCILIFSPLTLRPVFSIWMKFAHIMGKINTQVLLFIIFVFVFIPAGILLRLFGNDPMQRKKKGDRESYWEPYEISGLKEKNRYERQF